jgi:hypothetical protein
VYQAFSRHAPLAAALRRPAGRHPRHCHTRPRLGCQARPAAGRRRRGGRGLGGAGRPAGRHVQPLAHTLCRCAVPRFSLHFCAPATRLLHCPLSAPAGALAAPGTSCCCPPPRLCQLASSASVCRFDSATASASPPPPPPTSELPPSAVEEDHRLTGHGGAVLAVAVDDVARRLYSAGTDAAVRAWDLEVRSTTPAWVTPGGSSFLKLVTAQGRAA